MQISLVIITKNEAKNIAECIQSCLDVVDEVVILDEYSDDGTKEIVLGLGAQYKCADFLGFGEQKRLAVSLAKNNWVLCLDADERLSFQLKKTITSLKGSKPLFEAYKFNRLNHIGEKPVRYSGWYPDCKIRLFNRNYANWNKNKVHETVVMLKHDPIGFLQGDLIHFNIESEEDYLRSINKYARLKALKYQDKSKWEIYLKMFTSIFSPFLKMYIFQLGFLDGKLGWLIAKRHFIHDIRACRYALEGK